MRAADILLLVALAAGPAMGAPRDYVDDALMALGMTRQDCSFRTDYADAPDSFRISIVDSLLLAPLETEPYVTNVAALAESAGDLTSAVRLCATQLDLSPPLRDASDAAVSGAVWSLVSAALSAADDMNAAFAHLTEDERSFLTEHATELLVEEEFDPEKPIDVREREAEESEMMGLELLRVAGLVDYERIAAAGVTVAGAIDAVTDLALDAETLRASVRGGSSLDETPHTGVEGDVIAVFETEAGTVVLGGPGPTSYTEPAALIIDAGGDDRYACAVAGANASLPVSIVIDVSGNDVYESGQCGLGSGCMGVGVLVDAEGDDHYFGGSFSLGCGLFGVGLLRDDAGRDTYIGDTCSQGAGAFGIGALLDESDNDTYHAALYSQAFGFVKGFGLLRDRSGNDVYFAGGKYTDEIRYFDHFLSLSQGFGFGWRPDASGGVGLLVETEGNDVYVSDIFGQGASYWFAVGGLVDRSGNDQYISYQYAQGAGTHITVAALADLDGDDSYVSKGVSQGCGHDLAIGILRDASGDDNYTCHDLSQAAGNANGIGLLLDEAGDDSYSVRSPDNTHGYGNLRRDYGSIGLFIDCGGSDDYGGRGHDDEWWSYSTYGIGVDTNSSEGGRAE